VIFSYDLLLLLKLAIELRGKFIIRALTAYTYDNVEFMEIS